MKNGDGEGERLLVMVVERKASGGGGGGGLIKGWLQWQLILYNYGLTSVLITFVYLFIYISLLVTENFEARSAVHFLGYSLPSLHPHPTLPRPLPPTEPQNCSAQLHVCPCP